MSTQEVVIHKFPLKDLLNTIVVRRNAKILSVQDQGGIPTAWVQHCTTIGRPYRLTIVLWVTGHPFDFDHRTHRFISTLQMRDGTVLHAFELLEEI